MNAFDILFESNQKEPEQEIEYVTSSEFITLDWANNGNKYAMIKDGKLYKGKKAKEFFELLGPGSKVITENPPIKICRPLIDRGVEFYRCNGKLTKDRRDELGVDGINKLREDFSLKPIEDDKLKTDENDCIIIHHNYLTQPDQFHGPWYGDHPIKVFQSALKQTMKVRVALGNMAYQLEDTSSGPPV